MGQPYGIVSVQRSSTSARRGRLQLASLCDRVEGTNTIHGCRQGGLRAVTRAVEEIVAQLNERHSRHLTKPGRVNLVWPRKKKTHKW